MDIFRVNLGVKKYEKVLIFNDIPIEKEEMDESERQRRFNLRTLALLAAEIGKNYCKKILFCEYPATCGHGIEPPEELWKLAFGQKTIEVLKKEGLLMLVLSKDARNKVLNRVEEIIKKYKKNSVDCVIALSNYSTTHTMFRDFLTRICGCRYASMPLFDISMLEGPMCVDWKSLAKNTKKIADEINKADLIEVKTFNGTYITFSKKGRKVLSDTGILKRPGSFSNLPAGEVFLAPLEGTARGKLILEWAPTRRLTSPISLTVRDGYVTDIQGRDKYTEYLKAKLSERKENGNIAELGIGTNNRATRPDNILESEKIFGTIHIALGDNSSFGGRIKTPFHQDFVFFRPTVKLIFKDESKKMIIKSGKFLSSEVS
ncbi:MAG: aminopeptidase [Nitrospirae bacterium]|nr:aminopeptidase [Nitrospirota bacterium]